MCDPIDDEEDRKVLISTRDKRQKSVSQESFEVIRGSGQFAVRDLLAFHLSAVSEMLARPEELLRKRGRLHQFRIETRLVTAAVLLAQQTIDGKQSEKIVRRLRKVRRTAGSVRDLEVARDIILKHVPADSDAHDSLCALLRKRLSNARRQAQQQLEEKCPQRKFRQLAARIETHSQERGRVSVVVSTRHAVAYAVAHCLAQLSQCTKNGIDKPEAMHCARRRLRTLRLVVDLSIPRCDSCAELISAAEVLRNWQARLGRVNDLYRADLLLKEILTSSAKFLKQRSAIRKASTRLDHEFKNSLTKAAKEFSKSVDFAALAQWAAQNLTPDHDRSEAALLEQLAHAD